MSSAPMSRPASLRVMRSLLACLAREKTKGPSFGRHYPRATSLSRIGGSKARAAMLPQTRRPLTSRRRGARCPPNRHRAWIAHAPGTALRSELFVVKKLRVDRQHAALAFLLELHDAVDRRQNPVAEELVAPLSERVAVHADQLHQAVLERVRRQRELCAHRHRGG